LLTGCGVSRLCAVAVSVWSGVRGGLLPTDGTGRRVPAEFAEPVVSLRMADGSEVHRPLRDVRACQMIAAVPWRSRGVRPIPGYYSSAATPGHVIYESQPELARLHGRQAGPGPVIAAWLAESEASRRKTASPANMLAQWDQSSPAMRACSLKGIAGETGIAVETLADAARTTGISVRHGINGRAHPLADLGRPRVLPAAAWNASTRPRAEQRIRRLLALPGHPSLQHAARHLCIRHTVLADQILQLEAAAGITLVRSGQDEPVTLTADGEQFTRDVIPVLTVLARAGDTGSHAGGAAAEGGTEDNEGPATGGVLRGRGRCL
jgi:hypothetical protein